MLLPFTLRITAKLAQYHHMTPRQEKNFSHITVLTPLSSAGAGKTDPEKDGTDFNSKFYLVLVSDIIVVPSNPLVRMILGFKSPFSHLKT